MNIFLGSRHGHDLRTDETLLGGDQHVVREIHWPPKHHPDTQKRMEDPLTRDPLAVEKLGLSFSNQMAFAEIRRVQTAW